MTFLLFLEAPEGQLEFTLDGVTAQCDKHFEGFKSVPVGIHFMSYRYSSGSETGASTCLILQIPQNDSSVLVFSWNRGSEQFTLTASELTSDEKILKYPHLAAYESFMAQDKHSLKRWSQWTSHLDVKVLERCLKPCLVSSCHFPLFEVTPMDESHHALLQHPNNNSEVKLQFTHIPTIKTASGSLSPDELTKAACDRSVLLEKLQISVSDLLAELQLSFLLLVLAHNFEGFEQWIDILGLLCGSFEFAHSHASAYGPLFELLQVQFQFCPDDFFNGLLTDNKLFMLLGGLVSCLNDRKIPAITEFCNFFQSKFGIQLAEFDIDEYGEYAPTIVE